MRLLLSVTLWLSLCIAGCTHCQTAYNSSVVRVFEIRILDTGGLEELKPGRHGPFTTVMHESLCSDLATGERFVVLQFAIINGEKLRELDKWISGQTCRIAAIPLEQVDVDLGGTEIPRWLHLHRVSDVDYHGERILVRLDIWPNLTADDEHARAVLSPQMP